MPGKRKLTARAQAHRRAPPHMASGMEYSISLTHRGCGSSLATKHGEDVEQARKLTAVVRLPLELILLPTG